MEELGDTLWYLGNLATRAGLTLPELAAYSETPVARPVEAADRPFQALQPVFAAPGPRPPDAFEAELLRLAGRVGTFVFRGIRTPEAFEPERAGAAHRVRMKMLARDSANCRSCHVMEAIQPERTRGQRQHAQALEDGTTCIACHYNLVHKEVEPSEEFLQAIEQ